MATITLLDFSSSGRLLATRQIALNIRDLAEQALDAGDTVEFDFGGTNPTQSFVDELIGALIMERGKDVLKEMVMKNCSEEIKNILHFVVGDRLDQCQAKNRKEFV